MGQNPCFAAQHDEEQKLHCMTCLEDAKLPTRTSQNPPLTGTANQAWYFNPKLTCRAHTLSHAYSRSHMGMPPKGRSYRRPMQAHP